MFITLTLFIIGFLLLIKGADILVDGSVSLATRYGISNLVIGLTIVGFGTSAPELIVNLLSSISGNTDLAIGNIIGSNIANVFLILGICAIIYPLTVQRNTVFKEIPFSLLAGFITVVLASDVFLDGNLGATANVISRIDGVVLLSFFVIFMYYIFGIAKASPTQDSPVQDKLEPATESSVAESSVQSIAKSIIYIVLGLFALVIGGKWIVDGAVVIATMLGVSQSVIGLTIVAVGTSLPELATSVVAALKRQTDIAVGNIVGSNIFNIFWILGLSAVIAPLPLQADAFIDFVFLIGSSLLLFIIMFIGKRHTVEKWQGVVFVGVYILYVASFWFR